MKNVLKLMIITMVLLGLSTTAAFATPDCSKRKTKDDAVAEVEAAVAYYKANGRAKAMAEFSNQAGPFKNCELFLVVIDMKGNTLAHTAFSKMIGKNIMALTDQNGVKIIESFIDAVKDNDRGWSKPYVFVNPHNQILEPKNTFVAKVSDKEGDFIIGCGYHTAP